ncbi:MAG: hypothetical protein IPN13_10900 [Bacteroidetes bacterium]|nr:hypothetical protein [Bacteroidota bacterium]
MNKSAKRICITVTIILFFLIFTIPLFLMVFFENFPVKSPPKVVTLILQPDTKCSAGYTEEKFESISIGMSEKQVLDILGEPLTRWRPYRYTKFQDKEHFVGLQYSESPGSGHYNLRQINLDNGKVAEIISYFYID